MTIIYFKNLRQLLSLFNVGFAQAGVQLLRPKIEYMWTKNNYTRLTTNLTKNTAPIFSFSPFYTKCHNLVGSQKEHRSGWQPNWWVVIIWYDSLIFFVFSNCACAIIDLHIHTHAAVHTVWRIIINNMHCLIHLSHSFSSEQDNKLKYCGVLFAFAILNLVLI